MDNVALIGIDWGTSRLRAFRVGPEGQIVARRWSNRGIGHLGIGDFDPALREILDGWPVDAPIVMCGMVGSRQGWQEVAYRECPAGAVDIANNLAPLATGCGPAWIVAGVSAMQDVMRGEETLIFGAAPPADEALLITPGTHSKWVHVRASAIESFRTYMTGEIFGMLQEHSILGLSMEHHDDRYDEPAFLEGVHVGFEEPALLHSLFSVRTQALFGHKTAAALPSYLSGILIGSEVSGEARPARTDASVIVIATAKLGRLYQLALSAAGFGEVQRVDAEEAVARGLWRLWQLRGEAE